MLDPKLIDTNPRLVKRTIELRGVDVSWLQLKKFYKHYLTMRTKSQELHALRNKKQAGIHGKPDRASLKDLEEIKEKIAKTDNFLKKAGQEFFNLWRAVPNIVAPGTPEGDEKFNLEVERVEQPTKFDFKPADYLSIARKHSLLDIPRAVKIAGTRFFFLKNEAVALEFGLTRLAFQYLLHKGFTILSPPVMVRSKMMKGLGYLDRGKDEADELYKIEKDDLFLVATAEHSLVPMYANETFKAKQLPLRLAAFSTCFRREAGSYGKDTKGIFRVHQFDKIEMVSFVKPDESQREHEYLINIQKDLMKMLELPFRVVKIAAKDMGFPAFSQYDIEAWIPSQGRYRETHSASNTTDFQARRLNIKYREQQDKKSSFCHILNATALAIPRLIIAILENHQHQDGSVGLPKALSEQTGFKSIPSSDK